MVAIEQFQGLSRYERLVDLKKLRFIFDAVVRYMGESSKRPEALKILEVGCGDGSITLPLSLFGGTVNAFDIDENLVENVKRDVSARGIKNVSITKNDAYSYSAHGDKYDIIVVSEVLEHTDQPALIVAKLKDHLATGGYMIVTIPNGYGPWELKNKVIKLSSVKKIKDKECGHKHVQFFTLKAFKQIFSDHNFLLTKFGKSDAFSGLNYRASKNVLIANLDLVLADLLPSWLASGWYFVFKNNERTLRSMRES